MTKAKDNKFIIEETPLYKSIEKKYIVITELLLKSPKIDVNFVNLWKDLKGSVIKMETALYLSIERKFDIEIVKILLSNPKIDVNADIISYPDMIIDLFFLVNFTSCRRQT